MKDSFDEIIEKMGKPLWWNVHGAPHYKKKHWINRIHIKKYFRAIHCQECNEKFIVEMCDPVYADVLRSVRDRYGDPPRHHWVKKCWAGDTMGSVDERKLTKKEIDTVLTKV